MIWGFALVTALFAVLHIRADYARAQVQAYVFKPLTVLTIGVFLLQADPGPYRNMLLCGLGFSLVGDLFLMSRHARLLPGLVSFLIAHLWYIAAFSGGVTLALAPTLLPYIAFGIAYQYVVGPRMGKLRIPAIAYTGVVSLMSWIALERWLQTDHTLAITAFVGSVFFLFSDSLIGIERFHSHRRWGEAAILATYYTAQFLIACSAHG